MLKTFIKTKCIPFTHMLIFEFRGKIKFVEAITQPLIVREGLGVKTPPLKTVLENKSF